MKDERVDDLLKDLADALSVEPSPSVAARVRTRIAEAPRSAWTGLLTLVIPAAVAFVAVSAVLWWSWRTAAPGGTKAGRVVVSHAALEPASAAVGAAAEAPPVVDARQPLRSRPPREAAAPAAAVVQISPATRVAFEQLQVAAARGRITAASFEPDHVTVEPTVITPVTIEIKPIVIDVVTVGPTPSDTDSPVPSSSMTDGQRSFS